MTLYRFEDELIVKKPLEEVFEFFSNPGNLAEITPKKLGFTVLTPGDLSLYKGLIIDYEIKLFRCIPARWSSYIMDVKQNEYFEDVQLKGPYSYWHHRHEFHAHEDGTLIKDIIHYQVPLGFIGRIANVLLVKRDIKHIFKYRREQVKTLLGAL